LHDAGCSHSPVLTYSSLCSICCCIRLACRDPWWPSVTLLAGCLRDVHDVECQLLLFKTDAGNCFLRASSNSRTSAAVAEFLVSMICCIRGVLASQIAASSMKSIFIALRYNAGGGIWLFCWKSYSSWVSQRSAGDFPSYLPAISNFGRRIAEGGVGKAELDMVADCFWAWEETNRWAV
jgi:hypothetical protein